MTAAGRESAVAEARRAGAVYDEVMDAVRAEPVGSIARRLHSNLGDLAHVVLSALDTPPALGDDDRAVLSEEVAAACDRVSLSPRWAEALTPELVAILTARAHQPTPPAQAEAVAVAESVFDALDTQHDQHAYHVHAAECCWPFQGAMTAITRALTPDQGTDR